MIVFDCLSFSKTQYFVYLRSSDSLQIINCISSHLHKLLKYFNGTAIVASVKIQIILSASVFPINLVLYLRDLKFPSIAISALKLVALSLEWNHNFLMLQNNLNYILLSSTLVWLNLNLKHHQLMFHQLL